MSLSLKETIDRANKDGVKFMLTISTKDESFEQIIRLFRFKSVYGTYGIHPHEAKNHKNISTSQIIQKLNLNKKIIGMSGTGLDFYYNHQKKRSN